jgi:hypothetical protein
MSSNTLSVIPSAAELARRIGNIATDVLSIAADLVAAVDVNPRILDEMVDLGINRELLRRLEKLGRGQISPRLVFSTTTGERRLHCLPLSEQEHLLDQGVEVLGAEGDHRRIPVAQLSPAQCKQVFGAHGVRTLAEQRTWIEEHKPQPVAVLDRDYSVNKDSVTILRPVKISRQLLISILAQMN